MKITRYAMMLAAATGLLSACQKLDEVKAYDPDKVVAPVLHALPGEIVITPDNMGSTQTFTWDAADFGVRTQINYSIEASYNDGAKLVLFTGMNGTSSEQTYESLNNILALSVEDGGLGVPSGEPTDVDFYISATIGTDFEKFYSAPATVRMTVTTAERTYPQVWVIGDYCGWNFDNAQGLFCFSGDEVTYEAIVDLGEKAANGFKLSGEAGWNDACNWGTDGDAAAPETEAPSITLISSGGSGNIMVYSKRFYRFVFDRSTLTLSNKLSFNSMGIIGDATPGGWDTDTEMNFDTQKQRFWVDVTLTAGEFKFRADNDWAINFGGADGRLSQNGDNIKATAGNYRVYATLNNSAEITYELNAGDYGTGGGEEPDPGPEKADWYIHGQTVATPDWGPTAMESASSNIVAYKAAGVEVAANSEFLFKSGDESQWIGADAAFAGSSPYTCTIGSAFKVSADKVNAVIAEAGTYDYWLLPEAGRAYVMAAGAKPELVADTWGLVGNITGWGDLGDFSMSEEGAYLVRKGVALTTASEFKIRFNNAWDDSKNYGTASGGAVDINKAVDIITSGGSQNMKVQLDGTYDIYFDLANSQIYIMSEGNENVILCERGIRTFETSMRNTLDLAGVVMLHKMTHLPVVVDPSHACGHAWMVPELAKAAVAAGADGLMIEVHNNPAKAKCDGAQSLTPDQFDELMQFIGKEVEFFGKKMN